MAKGKKSKKKIFIFGGIGFLLVVIVILLATSGNKEKIVQIQSENAQLRTITQVVSATGKVQPEYQVVLRPEVTGEVVELPVEEGDFVKKGQLLIKIKPEQYIAQRNQAKAALKSTEAQLKVRQASLDRTKSEYKRIEGLYKKDLASEQELEIAKANYLQAEGQYEAQVASVQQADARLQDAQEQLDKTVIYSPINGWVTQLPVELSERVLGSSFSQGTHLMTVANLNRMESRVEVDENDVVLVSIGDTARVEIDAYGDKKFLGIVNQIGNSAQTSGFGTQDEVVNFEVRISLINPEEELRPGMSCDADIETETRFDVVSIPIQSVTARIEKPDKENGGENGDDSDGEGGNGGSGTEEKKNDVSEKSNEPQEVVFVVEEGKVRQVPVETGISDDTYIEIISGLEDGQEIVSGPYRAVSKELENGTKIMNPSKKKEKKSDDSAVEQSESEDKTEGSTEGEKADSTESE
jgi:HlyD family secretion protein